MRRLVISLSVSFAMIALLGSASAQGRAIRLEGWVQWMSSNRMMLASDAGPSIPVELANVPQDQYKGIRPRDRVMVIGVLSDDHRRVSATSVTFIAPGWADQSP